MKNWYTITIIDYTKAKNLTVDNIAQASHTIYLQGFNKVCEYLGGRPYRQRAGWSAMKGNTEFLITRSKEQ